MPGLTNLIYARAFAIYQESPYAINPRASTERWSAIDYIYVPYLRTYHMWSTLEPPRIGDLIMIIYLPHSRYLHMWSTLEPPRIGDLILIIYISLHVPYLRTFYMWSILEPTRIGDRIENPYVCHTPRIVNIYICHTSVHSICDQH